MSTIETSVFLTFTTAVILYFVGSGINRTIGPLKRWNIPEAVTGGLIVAVFTLVAFYGLQVQIIFDLGARDVLLLYFFTGIGLNACLSDLRSGGRPLLVPLLLTLAFLVIQNTISVVCATLLGLPSGVAPLLGSVSLIGGTGLRLRGLPSLPRDLV